ncbi:MAG: putative metal-dependent hydrolase [Pedobacter sp.]|uniref:YfiT family bacillithiol transferase n=1 Tax=Pedobacter sp. TaxID=1411316 RepID=UPI00280983DA|nr:putative metal-dependent hydrolase [Pedobacter sp.]MDQ8003176.1 putative metal-dependent hydrolase [Pedobacter sp.]
MSENIDHLKFPIGRFNAPEEITLVHTKGWIEVIESFPERLNTATAELSEEELEKQYRPNGWTIKQVVHHCADSHMNSFVRFKLALTEDTPTIKPYHENLWAQLSDYKTPIASSIKILEGLHKRWVLLLENLNEADLEKQFIHPENNELISLKKNIGIYAWHCNHHLAHILIAKNN